MSNLFTLMTSTDINTSVDFCKSTQSIWRVIGWFLMVFKIVIPILIIIFGIIDLGKAVIASKDDEIKKATNSLIKRIIAGVFIFFIPTIVSLIVSLVDSSEQWKPCMNCLDNPTSEGCSTAQPDTQKQQ